MKPSTDHRRRVSAASATALLLALAPSPAAAQQEEAIAVIEVAEEVIRWQPRVEAATWVLTVSGARTDLRREFASPEGPYLKIESDDGILPDGSYSYELQAFPEVGPEQRKRAAAARKEMERGARIDLREFGLEPAPSPLSGSFSVLNRRFVSPAKREPEPEALQTGDVRIDGSLEVGREKKFVATDPSDPGRQLVYAALEGPEAGTYLRGAARTAGGEAVIELPEHFARLTEAEGLTVQLTPTGEWGRLYVAEKSPRRLVVRSADGADHAFDYLVQGVRRGYAGFTVERPAGDPD